MMSTDINPPQPAPEAFFSYAREDSEFALRLAEDLKAAGAAVWLDQLDIQPGQRWDRAVEEALTRCVRMLVVLSPAAVNSTNVMDEVSFALEERKTIIPIIHRDCTIPFRVRRLQHVDFRQDYARALKSLLKTLVSRTETVPATSTVLVYPDDRTVAPVNEPQGALEHTVMDGDTRATEPAQYEAPKEAINLSSEKSDTTQAIEKGRLTHEQRLLAERKQREDDQPQQPESDRLERERQQQERRVAAAKRQLQPDHLDQPGEHSEDEGRQGSEQQGRQAQRAAIEQAQGDLDARLRPEVLHQPKERSVLPSRHEQLRQDYGAGEVAVTEQPGERHSFDQAALLSLVDRFGGVFWFVLALFLPWLLGITLLDGLPPIRWHVMIFGIACPGIAVLIPAIPVKRANTKYVLLALVILSLVTPFLGLAEMRAGITMSGSTGIGAWANGLSEVLRTLPFLVAGLYAIGTTMLPTTPVSLYAWTRLALLACSAFFVLTVAKNITGFYGMAAVGSGGIRLPWLARWLIEIAIPSGFERPTWL